MFPLEDHGEYEGFNVKKTPKQLKISCLLPLQVLKQEVKEYTA